MERQKPEALNAEGRRCKDEDDSLRRIIEMGNGREPTV